MNVATLIIQLQAMAQPDDEVTLIVEHSRSRFGLQTEAKNESIEAPQAKEAT